MAEANTNTKLWDTLYPTDPKHTKQFKRGGGFSGTAIKPMWAVLRATEVFGAVGQGWGWDVLEDRIEDGADGVRIWFSKVQLWYVVEGERFKTGPQWGATEFIAKRSSGFFTDEEAAKKSVTDALTKCLSYLGLGGDVHMGQFDDSKYVSDRAADQQKDDKAKEIEKATPEAIDWRNQVVQALYKIKDPEELRGFWDASKERFGEFSKGTSADKAVAAFVKDSVARRAGELKPKAA